MRKKIEEYYPELADLDNPLLNAARKQKNQSFYPNSNFSAPTIQFIPISYPVSPYIPFNGYPPYNYPPNYNNSFQEHSLMHQNCEQHHQHYSQHNSHRYYQNQ